MTQVPPRHSRESLGGRAGGARGAAADQLATNGRDDRRWLSDRQVLPSQRCAVTHAITAPASYAHLAARARVTDLAGPMIPAQSAPFPRADGASVMVGPSRQEGHASITIGMLRTTGSRPRVATERRAGGEGQWAGTQPSTVTRGPVESATPEHLSAIGDAAGAGQYGCHAEAEEQRVLETGRATAAGGRGSGGERARRRGGCGAWPGAVRRTWRRRRGTTGRGAVGITRCCRSTCSR